MKPDSDEELYRAYRLRGDSQALAVLFHRRVEQLLRLAVYLTPRLCDAEDLVQATFLTAIQRADTFRDGNRVLGWLNAVLVNHARLLRRRDGRRRLPSDAKVPPSDPATEAMLAEARSALHAGIDHLPEPYRAVLALHVEQGLDHDTIAQRLGRPPATIRKQLQRGIDRLRTLLPVGLAMGLLVRANPAQLAARSAARAVARGAVSSSGEATARAWRLGRRGWQLGAAAGVLLLVLAAMRGSPVPLPGAAAAIAQGERERTAPSADAQPAVAGSTSERHRAAPSAGQLVVTVRDTAGIARAGVPLLAIASDDRPLPLRLLSAAVAAVTTDGAGRAAFVGLAPGDYEIAQPGARASCRVAVGCGDSDAAVLVPEPRAIHGVVVDADGQAVANAEIVASETLGRGDLGTVVAMSGDDGTFSGEVPTPAHRVYARAPDAMPAMAVAWRPNQRVQLALQAARRIVVAVADRHGVPLARACVALAPPAAAPWLPVQYAATDAAGCCTMLRVPGAVLTATAAGLVPEQRALAANQDRVEVRLGPGGSVSGQVIDRAGRPAAGYRLQVSPAQVRDDDPGTALLARSVATDENGRFFVQHLAAGPAHLRVFGDAKTMAEEPADRCLLVAQTIAVVPGSTRTVRLQCTVLPELSGRVVDGDGNGVGDCRVLAIPDAGTVLHRLLRARGGKTDAAGWFRLPGVVDAGSYCIGAIGRKVLGASARLPMAVTVAQVGTPAEIVLPAAALVTTRLQLQVLGPGARPMRDAEVELRRADFALPVLATADGDGVVEFGQLTPGRHRVTLLAPGFGAQGHALDVPATPALASPLPLVLAEPCRLRIRATDRAGVPVAQLRALLFGPHGDRVLVGQTDHAGSVVFAAVAPGPHRLIVHGGASAPSARALLLPSGGHEEHVVVAPGVSVSVACPYEVADNPLLASGPVRIEITDRAGAPVLEDELDGANSKGLLVWQTALVPGSYRFVAVAPWQAAAALEFDVVAGQPLHLQPRLEREAAGRSDRGRLARAAGSR